MAINRKTMFEFINGEADASEASRVYNFAMTAIILLSLVPLMFKETNLVLEVIDRCCAAFFVVDYICRWTTADFKFGSRSIWSFVKYPFAPHGSR